MRKKKILIALASMILLVFFSGVIYFCLNPFILESSEIVVDYKKEFNPSDNIKFVFLGDETDIQFKGDVDTNTMGTYKGTYSYKKETKEVTIEVKDQTPPKLKVKQYKTDTVEEVTPEEFVDSVSDDTDVTLSFKKSVSKDKGTQKVTIVATDTSGNTTKKTAKLIRKKDTEGPTIEVNEDALTFKLGTLNSLDTSATVSDDFDSNPTLEIDTSMVNLNEAGTYTILYIAKDRSGNETRKEEKVKIQPNDELNQKVVYLTFDDGPSVNTPRILEILDKYNAKATFFVTGNGQNYNNYIKEAYDRGHSIGLHTYTHDYSVVYASVDSYFNDLNNVASMVEGIIGKRPDIIRFPGGSSNTISANYCVGIMSQLTQLVQEKGYQYYDWNVSSSDASGNNIPVDQIVSSSTSSDAQYINLLCHDTAAKDTTVEALPQIIEYYQAKGYVFKGITKDSYVPHHGVNN